MCLALPVAGCGGGQGHGSPGASGASLPPPRLADARPCSGIAGFTCATLTVPLDHAAQAAGTLRLVVAVQHSGAAPRGTLLFLTGGPGQPGVDLIPEVRARLSGVLSGYRLVMFDQRGTGAGALDCPALQAAAGSSDLVVVAGDTVPACARRLGTSRRYFTTPETVADIDSLRTALGVQKLTLDGVSYGTFVAEHYALAHPRRVAALVLDSVVPQTGVDPLYLASVQATARVLRAACAAQHCGSDPAADLAALIRAGEDGPRLQNAIVAESIASPSFPHVPEILHAAREGRPAALECVPRGRRSRRGRPGARAQSRSARVHVVPRPRPAVESREFKSRPRGGLERRRRTAAGLGVLSVLSRERGRQRPRSRLPSVAADRAARRRAG